MFHKPCCQSKYVIFPDLSYPQDFTFPTTGSHEFLSACRLLCACQVHGYLSGIRFLPGVLGRRAVVLEPCRRLPQFHDAGCKCRSGHLCCCVGVACRTSHGCGLIYAWYFCFSTSEYLCVGMIWGRRQTLSSQSDTYKIEYPPSEEMSGVSHVVHCVVTMVCVAVFDFVRTP